MVELLFFARRGAGDGGSCEMLLIRWKLWERRIQLRAFNFHVNYIILFKGKFAFKLNFLH